MPPVGKKPNFYLPHFSESRSSNWSTPSVHQQHFLGCLICVICNSKSFHSFLFKLNIMIVHLLKMYTSILCTFHDYFSSLMGVELRHFFHPKCSGGAQFV